MAPLCKSARHTVSLQWFPKNTENTANECRIAQTCVGILDAIKPHGKAKAQARNVQNNHECS